MHAEHGILTVADSPLDRGNGLVEDPAVLAVARAHEAVSDTIPRPTKNSDRTADDARHPGIPHPGTDNRLRQDHALITPTGEEQGPHT